MKHYNIFVSGKVQGVHFREMTKAVADQLKVKGFVQNREDGTVYIEAEADDFALDNLLDWCADGPDRAMVEELRHEEAELKGFTNFVVKR